MVWMSSACLIIQTHTSRVSRHPLSMSRAGRSANTAQWSWLITFTKWFFTSWIKSRIFTASFFAIVWCWVDHLNVIKNRIFWLQSIAIKIAIGARQSAFFFTICLAHYQAISPVRIVQRSRRSMERADNPGRVGEGASTGRSQWGN